MKENSMGEETYYDEREEMATDTYRPARPLKYFKGQGWIRLALRQGY